MNPRPYQSPNRDAAASRTRDRIVTAAAAILGTAEGIEDFSLQAVAKKAGVTRLTVYNQFGSRANAEVIATSSSMIKMLAIF